MKRLTALLSKESILKYERYVTLFIYYILPAIVVITIIFAIINTTNVGYSRQEIRGNLGWNLLVIILFIKPITFLGKKYLKAEITTLEQFFSTIKQLPKTIKNNQKKIDFQMFQQDILPFFVNSIYSISLYLMRLRRPLGIVIFWLLATHGLLYKIFRIRQGFPFFFNITQTVIRTGFLSLIALTIGAITSNNYSIKKLNNKRKIIQMTTAYLAFLFGAIHTENIFLLIIYFILKYIERKDTGTLKILINFIITKLNIIKDNLWIKRQRNTIKDKFDF